MIHIPKIHRKYKIGFSVCIHLSKYVIDINLKNKLRGDTKHKIAINISIIKMKHFIQTTLLLFYYTQYIYNIDEQIIIIYLINYIHIYTKNRLSIPQHRDGKLLNDTAATNKHIVSFRRTARKWNFCSALAVIFVPIF